MIIGITFVSAFILILTLSLTFYTGTFTDLERQQANTDVKRALHTIDNDLFTMEGMVGDWGWWDETYLFAQDLNSDYKINNLADVTFTNLRLNYFVITSPNGTVLYTKGYDLHADREVPVPEEILAILSTDVPPYGFPGKDRILSGLISSSDGPVLVASTPILTNDGNGPSPGFLVMGRLIDDTELARLSEVSGESISFRLDGAGFQGRTALFIPRPLNSLSVDVDQTNPYILTAVSAISDDRGNPALGIGIQNQRDSYQKTLALIRDYLIIFTLMMGVFACLVILIIDNLVLARLTTLVNRTLEGSRLPEGKHLPPMSGNDDFVQLDMVIKESQQRIRETEAHYRRIVETAQEGICILDADHRIIFANERMAAMLGMDHATLNGILLKDLIPEDERAFFLERAVQRKAGTSDRYECRLLGKDGRILWVLISATPAFSDQKYTGSFAMITDITDRKRAEIALELATKKLTTLNVITFNDLQNQLFTLQGYLELCEGIATGEKMKEYLARQRDVAGRIRQQIAFAQDIQKMGMKPPSWQDVNRIFLFAISHLDLSSITREITLNNLEVYADPLLENVLFSLADNSLRHGKIVTRISISYTKSESGIVILYEDNGMGIPPEMKEAIFEQRYSSGTGVSLFLAREILSITGITIRETGTYQKGARFELSVQKGGFRFTDHGNATNL